MDRGLFTPVILNHRRFISLLIGESTPLMAFPVVTMVTAGICVSLLSSGFLAHCSLVTFLQVMMTPWAAKHGILLPLMLKCLARKFTIAELKKCFYIFKVFTDISPYVSYKFSIKQSFHFKYPGDWSPKGNISVVCTWLFSTSFPKSCPLRYGLRS